MKKLIKFLLFVLILFVGYGYLIKKKLPASIGEKAMAGVQELTFMDEGDYLSIKDMEYSLTVTKLSYAEGFKQVSEKTYVDLKKTGGKDNLNISFNKDVEIGLDSDTSLVIKCKDGKYYVSNNGGAETEDTKEGVKMGLDLMLALYSPVDEATGKLKYLSAMEKFDKVEQIHTVATGYVKTDDVEIVVSYNFMKKKIESFQYSIDTKDAEGYLILTERYEFNFK